ncbi:hypothetical protein B0H11DRAFT_1950760 [Mycena galericulata]|nr:hypothetical protein B0H11DRAFT_1950760 [Mycena galericulata]
MSLDSLSNSALEALLEFYLEAVRRRLEERLRTAPMLPEFGTGADERIEHADPRSQDPPDALQSPFNPGHLHPRRSLEPSPSPPSTPVRRARPEWLSSPRPMRALWPTLRVDTTSPTPSPPYTTSRKRGHVAGDEENSGARKRIRLDPGWPRGFIRVPPRRTRLWDKENVKCA